MKSEYIIGIDLGGTNIKGALVDREGRIIFKEQMATLANAGPQAVAARIGQVIKTLEVKAAGNIVSGLGIGIPGQPDNSTGSVVYAPNLHWRNVPLVDYLRGFTDLPVYMENDANVAAIGEQWQGAGRGSLNMIMITIGTGIGGGLILNGRLYTGTGGSAGEIGHTVIDPEGPLCSCGRRGCLETLTSATAMIRMAGEAIDRGEETILSRTENLEARDIVMAASTGDRVASRVLETVVRYLGMGLGNLINLFNPDTIVVGGGVSKAGDILFTPLRREAVRWSLPMPASQVQIVPAQLGNDAGSIGAAGLHIHRGTGDCS